MPGFAAKARSSLAKFALLFVSLALLVAVGEGILRGVHARRASSLPPDSASLPVLHGLFDLVGKNVRGLHLGVLYRTNDQGIRGPDYPLVPDKSTYRILVAGDSVTMGQGLPEEDAYPRVLERLLNANPEPSRPSRRYEVLNLGLAGVDAAFATTRLSNLGDVYHPDLLVYGFTLNDIEGPHYRRIETGAGRVAHAGWQRALRFRDSPLHLVREFWPRWVMLVEHGTLLPGAQDSSALERAEWNQNYFENPAAWGDFTDALGRMAAYARQRDVCGHVFLHTYLTELGPEHPFEPVYERVSEAARAQGLGVTESFAAFRNREASDLWIDWYDSHPNAAGQEILARALLEGLRALPKACWRAADERSPVASPAG